MVGSLGRVCRVCLGTTRRGGKCSEATGQLELVRRRWMSTLWNFPGSTNEHGNLEHCGGHEKAPCVRPRAPCGLKLAVPSVTTEPKRLTQATSVPADIFTTAAVPGRCAALNVCVASSSAAAARGDVAHAAFDRKTTHRREIQDLRVQGIVCRPLVRTAHGRPHPASCCHPNDAICR